MGGTRAFLYGFMIFKVFYPGNMAGSEHENPGNKVTKNYLIVFRKKLINVP